MLNISSDKNKIKEIFLFDTQGRMMLYQSNLLDKNRIDLSNFIDGIYFLITLLKVLLIFGLLKTNNLVCCIFKN